MMNITQGMCGCLLSHQGQPSVQPPERMGREDHYFLKPHPGPAMQHLEAWVVVVVAVHAVGWVKGLLAEDFCRVRTWAEKPCV